MRQLGYIRPNTLQLGNRLMSLLRRHCLAISLINRDPLTSFLVRDYFDLPRSSTLYAALKDKSLGQADVVLCLLRLRDAQPMPDRKRLLSFYIARLVGRPIAIGMPCLLHYRVNGHAPVIAAPPTPAERRVAWVTPTNPRQPGTVAHQRWRDIKVGRTVAQLRIRGITRRDLRKAERRGWLRYEEVAA